jgi:soluble lytic murein transglycosylase-like protein
MESRLRNIRSTLCLLALPLLSLLPAAGAFAQDGPDPELINRLRAVAAEADSFPDKFDAQVWLTDMSARLERQVKDPEARLRILQRVHYEATRRDMAPELILAVIDIESNFDPYAISVSGALGLMQIMPFWVEEIDEGDDNLIRIETNLRYGCTILQHYLQRENGDLRRALARYNGSVGKTTYPDKVLDRLRTKWYRA